MTVSHDQVDSQEIMHGLCPPCRIERGELAPTLTGESSNNFEFAIPAPTTGVVSYVRSLRGRARKIVRSLRSTESNEPITTEEHESGATDSVSSTNIDSEIVGKENINASQLSERARSTVVIVTGGLPNTLEVIKR